MTNIIDKSSWTNSNNGYTTLTSETTDNDLNAINDEKERIDNEAMHKKLIAKWNKQFRYGNQKQMLVKRLIQKKDFAMRKT